MVVHAKVTDAIDALSRSLRRSELLDDERSRLLPAAIAARSLTSLQRCDHPLGQRGVGVEESAAHGGKHFRAREHVSLDCEPVFDDMPRPFDAATPCECSCSSPGGDRSQLAELSLVVLGERLLDRHLRVDLRCERTQHALAVAGDHSHRLRRDRTDAGPHPRRDRTDREVLRLNRATDLAGCRIGSDDRERSSLNGHEATLPAQKDIRERCTGGERRGILVAVVRESELVQTEHGLVPKGDGWFVLDARETQWWERPGRGVLCEFEGAGFEGATDFVQLGINLTRLEPGEPMAMYHWEADQEDFLVLAGEALLVVEGEERALRAWDFVHCPPGTKHTIVGAGTAPCLVLAVGARDRSTGPDWGAYTVDEAALRHEAGVERETTEPDEAYARFGHSRLTRYRDGWLSD